MGTLNAQDIKKKNRGSFSHGRGPGSDCKIPYINSKTGSKQKIGAYILK
jgi:hypothetical protein